MIRKSSWFLVISGLLLLMSAQITFAQGGIQQPTAVLPRNMEVDKIKIIQRIGNQIPLDAKFKDQDGKPVTFGSLLHKRPVLVLAIFYRCMGVCGVELANLVEALGKMKTKTVGKDFDIIVVGIDPVETPDLAKDKLKETIATSKSLKGTEAGWTFLTGDMENIRAVTNKLGFYYTYDKANDIVNHPAGLMFVTPTGIMSSYILGAEFSPKAIAADLDTAGRNQLGIKSPDIFFGCIHIDPITGKTSLVIENVLKVLAFVTVVCLLVTVLTLSGKAKWKKKKATGVDEWGDPI